MDNIFYHCYSYINGCVDIHVVNLILNGQYLLQNYEFLKDKGVQRRKPYSKWTISSTRGKTDTMASLEEVVNLILNGQYLLLQI